MIGSKKGMDFISGVVIFTVLNVLFFSIMFVFVGGVGSGSSFIENAYSKKIALAIDSIKPGTELTIYLTDLFNAAEKNKFPLDRVVSINYDTKSITVMVEEGDGKTYTYITDLPKGSFLIDSEKKLVVIKI